LIQPEGRKERRYDTTGMVITNMLAEKMNIVSRLTLNDSNDKLEVKPAEAPVWLPLEVAEAVMDTGRGRPKSLSRVE